MVAQTQGISTITERAACLEDLLQSREQWEVGRRPLELLGLGGGDPTDFGVFDRNRFAFLRGGANKGYELETHLSIFPENRWELAKGLDPDLEFLINFTDEGLFRMFPRFNFAPRKLPEVGEVTLWIPASGEDGTSGADQGANNPKRFGPIGFAFLGVRIDA